MILKYDFDGIRIDTARHVKKLFLKEFNEAAGVYSVGEVWNLDVDYVASFQKDGLDGLLNFPLEVTA